MSESNRETNRQFCLDLLKEYTKSESLLKHAYSVEACLRAYAKKYQEDEEFWGNVGLLHDFDYEKYPTAEDHPYKGIEILKDQRFSEEFRQTILSHASYSGEPRDTLLKKVLFACDELTGFILAVVYVRPNKKIDDLKVKSVKKKFKVKAFAAAVSRQEINQGVEDLGLELDEHIEFCIEALKKNRENLGI